MMKKNWYSYFDYIKFSIILLMVGLVLIGIGNIPSTNSTVNTIFSVLRFSGGIIKMLFPLAVIVNFVGERNRNGVAVIAAIISYFILEICTMFFCKGSYPAYCYNNYIGLNAASIESAASAVRQPLNLGLIASAVVILITNVSYDLSQKRYNYGFLSFISNDAWFFLILFVLTLLSGVIVSASSSFFIDRITNFMSRISGNSANPAVMFAYGVLQEIMNLLGIPEYTQETFLVGQLGGSWIDTNQIIYLGDINIWTAQTKLGTIQGGVGKYITPLYVINIFLVPSIMLGYCLHTRNRIERKKMIGLAIFVTLCSFLGASALPLRYVILMTAPIMVLFFIGIIGLIFMVFSMMQVTLGYSYSGSLLYANPGNIFDFSKYFNSLEFHSQTLKILLVGLVIFVIVQLLVWAFYTVLAQDFLEPVDRRTECKKVISALGGIDNIEMVTSTINDVIVVLKNADKINIDELLQDRAYSVKERYFGYVIGYGPGSLRLCKMINSEMNDYQDCKKYIAEKETANG